MNELENHAEIITKMSQLMLDQVNGRYEYIACEFEYLERYGIVSSTFSVMLEWQQSYPDTATGFATENLDLCMKLRGLMKGHTGGEWTSFTLSLDAIGKAKTKFKYT